MTTQVFRGKLGYEDVELGLGTFQRYGPTGVLETITQLRASHIPILDALTLYEASEVEAALAEVRAIIDRVDFPETVQKVELRSTAGWEGEHLGLGLLHGNLAEMTRRLVLPGVITMYGAAAAPSGWLLCDGDAVSRVTYAALFAVISTTYGVGDGSTTFDLPDMMGRFPIGAGAGAGLTNRVLAATGGAETVDLEHSHTIADHTHAITVDNDTHNHQWYEYTGGLSLSYQSDGSTTEDMGASAYSGQTGLIANVSSGNPLVATDLTGDALYTKDDTHNHTASSGNQSAAGTDDQLSTTQTIMNPFLALSFIIKT